MEQYLPWAIKIVLFTKFIPLYLRFEQGHQGVVIACVRDTKYWGWGRNRVYSWLSWPQIYLHFFQVWFLEHFLHQFAWRKTACLLSLVFLETGQDVTQVIHVRWESNHIVWRGTHRFICFSPPSSRWRQCWCWWRPRCTDHRGKKVSSCALPPIFM